MTDPFEDIVRNALRGTSGAAGEMPTYHGAWQRGRRRRWIKRSALVASGAFVLLAALTVNLGRLPGSEPIETSDVATGAAAAVAATPIFEPTPLATTAMVETSSLSDGDTDSVQAAPTAPTASAISPADTPTVVPQAAATPTTVAQTTVPPAAVTPTVVAATALPPTAVPQTSVPQTGAPTAPVPTPEALSTPPPTVEALPTADAETPQEPASLAGTAQQPVDPGGTDEPSGPPQGAFTRSHRRTLYSLMAPPGEWPYPVTSTKMAWPTQRVSCWPTTPVLATAMWNRATAWSTPTVTASVIPALR